MSDRVTALSRLSRRRLIAACAAVSLLAVGLAQLVPWVAERRNALLGGVAWAAGPRDLLLTWSSLEVETPLHRCGLAYALAATEAGFKVGFDPKAGSPSGRRLVVGLTSLQLGAPFAFDDPSTFTTVNRVGRLAEAMRKGAVESGGWVSQPMRPLAVAYGEAIHLVGGGKPILGPKDLTGRRLLLRRPLCQRDEYERLAPLLTVEECAAPDETQVQALQSLPKAEADRVVLTASATQAVSLPRSATANLSLSFARIVGIAFVQAVEAGGTDEEAKVLREIARKATLICGRANFRAEREAIEALRARGTRVFLADRAAFNAASRNILTNKLADAREAVDRAAAADKAFQQRLAEVYEQERQDFDTIRRSWAP